MHERKEAMRGFSITRIFVIVCEACNENILERADERQVYTNAQAEQYAREHRAQHFRDGSWPWPKAGRTGG
jgi:hypothetical protein